MKLRIYKLILMGIYITLSGKQIRQLVFKFGVNIVWPGSQRIKCLAGKTAHCSC